MSEIMIERLPVGDIGANCYFVVNPHTKEMLIIDPGGNGSLLINKINKNGWKPVAVLLTHGHCDHVHHAKMIADEYQIHIYAHELEKETLGDPILNTSAMFGGKESYAADKYVIDKQILKLANFKIEVLWIPGHTVGGVCYYFIDNNIVFTGDVLFSGTIGRTDFKNGSMELMLRGIHEKLMVLPDDTRVLPGHMIETTIGEERCNNSYLQKFV